MEETDKHLKLLKAQNFFSKAAQVPMAKGNCSLNTLSRLEVNNWEGLFIGKLTNWEGALNQKLNSGKDHS